uniref:Uncharacterized protein n=1 Tax=Nonomuraea gerenzanensis TaxID=93944 RepID=A0A1M4EKA4_9ACTN|nr:hypothetical protein BN4615_P8732 [Nonomuraea gerenzanensis]
MHGGDQPGSIRRKPQGKDPGNGHIVTNVVECAHSIEPTSHQGPPTLPHRVVTWEFTTPCWSCLSAARRGPTT